MPRPGYTVGSAQEIKIQADFNNYIYISNKNCTFFKYFEPKSIQMTHYLLKAKNKIKVLNKRKGAIS
jgi:hypothetical protein